MDSRIRGSRGSRALAIDVFGAPACMIGEHRWIPAFAGMTEEGVPGCAVRTIIPAFAGMTIEATTPPLSMASFPHPRE